MVHKGRHGGHRGIFHAIRPYFRVFFEFRRAEHTYIVAVPLRIRASDGHFAVERQIPFHAGVPALGGAFLHKVAVKILGIFPVRERQIPVAGDFQPVVLRLQPHAAALMPTGDVVIIKGVVAHHPVAGIHGFAVVFEGRAREPALAQADVAYPAVRAVLLPPAVHGTRTNLRIYGGVQAVVQGPQHITFAAEAAFALLVKVPHEIEPRLAVAVGRIFAPRSHEAEDGRLHGTVRKAHARRNAPLQQRIGKILPEHAASVATVSPASTVPPTGILTARR